MTSERTVTNERTVICGTPNCFAADGLSGCRDGYTPVPTCPNIQHIEATEPDVRAATIPPWSGLPLGEVDAEAIVGTGQPRLVALVGLSGSGKATALAAFWTLLRRGHRPAGHDFAGSYTLLGWHAIARHMAWHPEGQRQFPPHTTATGEREPALLHTALKRGDSVYDLLFTDLPGEWFREWAFDRDAVPGANWIASQADLFMLLSDSKALSGAGRGAARAQYDALAARVAEAADGSPVLPVRAKADLPLSNAMEKGLSEMETQRFGRPAAPMSVYGLNGRSDPCLDPIDVAIDMATAPVTVPPPTRAETGDPFLDFSAPVRRASI